MMQSFFDKYNLNAFERRLVVIVGLVVFLIINMALVWPQFADWGEIGKKMDQAGQKIASFNRLIGRSPQFKAKLAELEGIGS
ncbi:hypothetical protein OAM00_05765, partial [Verrucomicrobia bacterium]|nr:hypothetical protein [Verrucomicrobiota bacterium]